MILVFIHRFLHPLTLATVPDARIFMCLTVNNPGNQPHNVPPNIHTLFQVSYHIFTLTANRAHISSIGFLPVCSVMIGYILDIQLFLLPQRAPYRSHRNNSACGNQVTANSHKQGDLHTVLLTNIRG